MVHAGSGPTFLAGGAGTAGPPRQGYDGGAATGYYVGNNWFSAGGGGGAGGVGAVGTNSNGVSGAGGIGLQSSIDSVYYASGGGGGGNPGMTAGTASAGGGGAGVLSGTPNAGGINLGGGGGGGGGTCGVGCTGGAGGSGVVIIKIVDTATATFSAGVSHGNVAPFTNGLPSTSVAGYKIYTVSAGGALDTVTFS